MLSNLQRHPVALMHAAQAAMSADLRAEMATLARRQLPVLVLWSDDDRVIPLAAFDTFCATFGTDGHVVQGGHSWLLANPDVLGEVLDNVIHVQGGEHGARAATASVSQLRTLLAATTMPTSVAARLLEGVSPLWVMSEAPDVLAADLALCHPGVGPREVRAVARPMAATNTYRLTVVARDRRGFLADTAAVLAASGVTIESASAMTWPDRHVAMHALTVRTAHGIDDVRWDAIGARLTASIEDPAPTTFVPTGRARVTRTGSGLGTTIVRVTAPDNIGLLSVICRWFADHGVSVEAAAIATDDAVANDVFLLDGDCDTKQLALHLSGPPATPPCVRALRSIFGGRTGR